MDAVEVPTDPFKVNGRPSNRLAPHGNGVLIGCRLRKVDPFLQHRVRDVPGLGVPVGLT